MNSKSVLFAPHLPDKRRPFCSVASASLLAVLCTLPLGCSRTFYRQQADTEAYCLVDNKSAIVGAPAEEFRIEIDPRSRMFDPNDPDVEPMPPDDPLSHQYMQSVDCKESSKHWQSLPRTPFVDNPAWQTYLPRNEDGEVVLDIRGAVDLALLESPNYQSNLEDLYLSALDVSFERFRFDAQFFGGSSVFYDAEGRDAAGGDASSVLTVSPARGGSPWRIERLTATGGTIVAGFANSLIWQFAGPNDYTSSTLFDFAILQPLLRAGGRIRIMERLTIAERTLLANVRAMERFRRGFYLNIVTGRDAGQGPSRRGGFFGGAGLEGFSGVGGGGFGNVGRIGGGFGGGGGGGGITGGAGAQGAGGYMGLLQSAQQIYNQRANVSALRESVEQLQASYDAGRIDRFQVDLSQQALYTAQSQLLTSETFYEIALENFKLSIGLPPELDVKIEDPLLNRFTLLDPELEALQDRLAGVLSQLRQLRSVMEDGVPPAEPLPGAQPPIEAAGVSDDLVDLLAGTAAERLDRIFAALEQVESAVAGRIDDVESEILHLDDVMPKRRELLSRLASRPEVQRTRIDPRLFDPSSVDARVESLHRSFEELRRQLGESWQSIHRVEAANLEGDRQLVSTLIDALAGLSSRLLELTLIQASARLEAITFDPVELAPEEALVIASVYRRDWQNARANLVDTWRLIYFNANDLMSDLDIVFAGDIGNLGDNPFRVRDTTGRLRVGLEFDAPLTRLAERNVYRQSLIEYQQARRSYYQFRDRLYFGLRNTLRQIRLNEINFELRRAAVLVAIAQVDLTQLRLYEPPQPGVVEQFSNTTARDLVQSLSDLLNVQNDFLSVWVNYEVQRLSLDFDLGIMQLDPNGQRVELTTPLSDYFATALQQASARCHPSDLQPGAGVANALPNFEESRGGSEPIRFPEVLGPTDELEPLPLPTTIESGNEAEALP